MSEPKYNDFMFIVKYNYGEWDDFTRVTIFVTQDENFAKRYVDRFNSILQRLKDYYNSIEITEQLWERWYAVNHFSPAYYHKIEIRNEKPSRKS
jgi:hypothetical protein